MFEFHLPSPAAAAWKQCSGAVISIIFRELQCYSWQHSGQWRHHTSHFSNTVILETQFRNHKSCCCIFSIFVVICILYCEAQGKGRAKGRLRKSIVDYRYRLSIIDIVFPEALHYMWLPPSTTTTHPDV